MHALVRSTRLHRFGLTLATILALATACGGGGGGGGGPSIQLSRSSVNVEADAGGALPDAWIVTADFDGDIIAWGIPTGGPAEMPAWVRFDHGAVYGDEHVSHLDFAVGATTTDLLPGLYTFVMRIGTGNGETPYDMHDVSYLDLTITYLVNDVTAVAAGAPAAALVAQSAAPADQGLARVLGAASAR